MNQRSMKFIAAAFCLCLLAYQPCEAQDPSQEEFNWASKHFFPVFKELFPIEEEFGYSLGYRSYRDLYTDELETGFVFNRVLQEKYLSAVIRTADTVSIYDQIIALHRKDKDAGIDAIKPHLKIKERRLSEETCPAVRRQFDKFYGLSLQTLSARDRSAQRKGEFSITLHPRAHVFHADISGGKMELVLSENDHPFVRWAEQTMSALEACAQKQKNG